jgi:hypothetical protein
MAHRLTAQAFHKKGDNAKAIEQVDRAAAIFAKLRDASSLRESDGTRTGEKPIRRVEEERCGHAEFLERDAAGHAVARYLFSVSVTSRCRLACPHAARGAGVAT